MDPHLIVARDLDELAARGAELVAQHAHRAIAERGRFSLALSGGATPRPLYQRLAADTSIDWERVLVFWGDERCIEPDSPHSNYQLAREALLKRVSVPPANVFRVPVEAGRPRDAARQYESLLRRALGGPVLDLVLLGLGSDGHVASLFPHQARDARPGRLVRAVHAGLPPWIDRVTLTFEAIRAARARLLLCGSSTKAGIVKIALEGDPKLPGGLFDARHYPVHDLRELPGTTWLLDTGSATTLTATRLP